MWIVIATRKGIPSPATYLNKGKEGIHGLQKDLLCNY